MTFYIFDVDGVLTDEHARPSEEVLHTIEKLHKQNEQLAFITGRSRKWLADHIFSSLNQEEDWSGLFCVAEHGAIKGKGPDIDKWELDKDFVVPDEVKEELLKISQKQDYDGLIEWDHTKESMGTVESVHGDPGDEEHLKKTQKALKAYSKEAEEVADKHDKKVVVSTYGVDVVPKDLSKKIGAEWVFGQASAEGKSVYVFGDSHGDFIMAETARQCGAEDVTFFWVGDGEPPESQDDHISIKSADGNFARGTLEVLNNLI
ncbi:HAD-IIB family hydrolase [Rossellomorea aquimaris]|uniref:HAD family phosphatase n=1 Tax=Rossellomorea aquimaris TaxID=189382 RepID=A0A5D4TTY6_9BACI|nr:HAD-IIB family hydrolase [Rossellomorea aquimaris]TYS78291.1 HAD family phosphatase [Rossellomorea aquimaris]